MTGAGSSYVSRAAAATAARARETSRQVAGGEGYASRAAAAVRPAASAGQVQSRAETPQRPSAGAGSRRTSAASPSQPLQSATSSPAALSTAAARRLSAATGGVAAATSPLQPGGSGSSVAARTSPKALTYTEWLQAQARTPAAQPQWRSPNDRKATAKAPSVPASSSASTPAAAKRQGSSPQVAARATATAAAAGAGAVPRTPPPIRPRTSKSGRGDADDASSPSSTPTAHSPAAASAPPSVARRLLLPSDSASRQLSFLEPGDSDSGGGGDSRRDSGELAGGGGDSDRDRGGGSGAARLPGGLASRESSSLNLNLLNEPSITSLTAGGRLRLAVRAMANGSGGGGSGPGSPAGDSGSGSGRLVFPGAAAVAAAISSLSVRRGGAAAAVVGGAGGEAGGAMAVRDLAMRDAAPPQASEDEPSARGLLDRQSGAWGRAPNVPSTEHDASAASAAAAYNGYKGVRLHDYLHHHQRQQGTGAGGLDSGTSTYDGGLGVGTAGASTHPSERIEYGISGTETCSEVDEASDSASILLDDIVRQASVTGVMQISPRGTLRRLSSRGAGGGAGFPGAGRPSSGASAHVTSAAVVSVAAGVAAGAAAAATLAGPAPESRRPQRSASARQPRSGWQAKAQLKRTSSIVTDREDGGVSGGSIQRLELGLGRDAAAGREAGHPRRSLKSRTAFPPPSGTTPDPGLANTPIRRQPPWEIQTLGAVARVGGGSGDGDGGDARSPAQGRPQSSPQGAESPPRDGAAPAAVTRGSGGAAAPDPAAPQFARVRSFWLRMTSEWVPDGAEEAGNRAVGPAAPGGDGGGAGAGGRGSGTSPSGEGGGEGSSQVAQRSATASPLQGSAGVSGSPHPRPPHAAEPPHAGPDPAWAPKPPLPQPLGDVRGASPGRGSVVGPPSSASQPHPTTQPPHRHLSIAVPPQPLSPSLPLPPTHHYQQHTQHLPSPPSRNSSGDGGGSGGRQARSLSAPRASIASSNLSMGRGPPGGAAAPSAGGAPHLTSLARDLRDSVRSPGGAAGVGTRPAWAMASRTLSGRQLLQHRGSHGAIHSPVPSEAGAAASVLGRGSISGMSTFSALSGPQAGVMYNYPSHGYIERAAEYGRWEAAMLLDLDLYGSMNLAGCPSPDDYDDPSYLTRSQSGLASLPPSGAAAKPFGLAPRRPSSGWLGAAVAAAAAAANSAGSGADAPPPPAPGPALPRRHMPLRRTVSASAAMLAAAAANAAAQAAGASPMPGATRGSALSSRLLMRSSRSWSALRFSSATAGGQGVPGSPLSRITGDSMLEALDQILEEESSGRLSTGLPDQPTPDSAAQSHRASGAGAASGAASAGPAVVVPALTSPPSFGSSPREPSLGAWTSFRRQSSYRRSGSSDGRLNFNLGGGNASSFNSRRNSVSEAQARLQQQPAAVEAPPSSPAVARTASGAASRAAAAPPPPPPPPEVSQPPLVGPTRCLSPPLAAGVADLEDVRQAPFPFSAAAAVAGSRPGGFQEYINPLAELLPEAEAAAPAHPASPPRHPGNAFDSPPPGPVPFLGAARSFGAGQTQGQASPQLLARGPRADIAWPSPPPSPPPPQVPPTIPEEVVSHPLTGLALQLSPYSSDAGSTVSGVVQALRRQEGQQQQQQPHGRVSLGIIVEGGLQPGSETGSMYGAASAPPSRDGRLARSSLHPVHGRSSHLPPALDDPAGAPAPAAPGAAGGAGSLHREDEPYHGRRAAGPALLAPNGSSGSSSRDSSEYPAQVTAAALAMDEAAAAAATTAPAAPLNCSHATPPVEWLLRAGWDSGPGIRPSQLRPALHHPGGAASRGAEHVLAPGGQAPAPAGQEFRRGGSTGPPGPVAPYPPPSLESIQRLLDTDLPSPAIAAAVAVLAGSLPQSWVRPQPPGQRDGWPPYPPQRLDDAAARTGPVSRWPAPAERGVAAAGSRADPGVAASAAYPDVHGAGLGASAGAAEAGLPYESAGRSNPMTRSYMALLTLAGERGMPPKPLQEDGEQPAAAAARPDEGDQAQGDAQEGLAEAAADGEEDDDPRAGSGHRLDGPLGRAVRLIAQSMLIVLAGAAGATAAASSANAVFMRPEDLPYEHGTSIYYSKYPRNKRFARTQQR